ncbi:pectate lyase [Streptomyces armeniacus]|uniref:pectate lyase n=1 Tax=Streptomyces armeniacus TaxID=83291 RepID=A0A345XJR7_9ACTN|nr:right-handed parallel beta-helix repeat-containing protein [Streptomyces armeniacus]AXK31883.1 pectate lyase [Streptomyces armeniacus]
MHSTGSGHRARARSVRVGVAAVAVGAVIGGLAWSGNAAESTGADSPAASERGAGDGSAAAAEPVGFGAGTTGGAGGETVTVSGAQEFTEAVQSEGPLTVQVEGAVELDGMTDVAADKTVVGVGTDGGITGGGLNISGVENVIVQNLTFSGSGDDAVSVDGSTHVWIDHNDLSNAYDGLVDIKNGSDEITVSWNHLHDHDKSMLLGHSDDNGDADTGKLRVTYDHNWFDGTGQRHPRVRFGNPVHVLNNYYSDIGSYGVASTTNAGVLVEGNSFENVEDPFHLGEGSSEPGALAAKDNHMVGSGEGETGGEVAEIPYAYTPDAAADVKSLVTEGAGVGRL